MRKAWSNEGCCAQKRALNHISKTAVSIQVHFVLKKEYSSIEILLQNKKVIKKFISRHVA
jgi:hypothetical protein